MPTPRTRALSRCRKPAYAAGDGPPGPIRPPTDQCRPGNRKEHRTKSLGAGACTGCNAGAQLNLQGVWASEPAPAPQVEDYTQGPQSTVTLNRRNQPVPTLEHTWGALKAMYR